MKQADSMTIKDKEQVVQWSRKRRWQKETPGQLRVKAIEDLIGSLRRVNEKGGAEDSEVEYKSSNNGRCYNYGKKGHHARDC